MLTRKKSFQKLMKTNPAKAKFLREQLQEALGANQQAVEDTFMRALIGLDSNKIHRIADAVLYFQSRSGQLGSEQSADPIRCRLLLLRRDLEQKGKKMSVREVAEHLSLGNTPEDGFAALRRLCKSLHFPLSNTRQEGRVIRSLKS